MHVLIAEDDRTIAENLYDFLEARGHQCDFANSLAGARALLAGSRFDAIALDRNLPDGDGATLARSLREAGQALPILMLTARDQLDGFAAGADDYLVKPFALKEVEARLLALQRRAVPPPAAAAPLTVGQLSFDPLAHKVRLAGRQLDLPPKAVKLLATMLPHPDRLFTRRELEIAVWGHEQEASDKLHSVLHTLRKALDGNSSVTIHNIHGLGYKLGTD